MNPSIEDLINAVHAARAEKVVLLPNNGNVILTAEQSLSRTSVMAKPNAKPVPYQKSDKYKFLGMYGETADMTGGFGQKGVQAQMSQRWLRNDPPNAA